MTNMARTLTTIAVAATMLLSARLGLSENDAGKPTARAQASEAKSSHGAQEGIKVHGNWTITVRNRDGSIASRNRFTNSLATSGQILLVDILSRGTTVGLWEIKINSPICSAGGTPTACQIDEVFVVASGPQIFKTLTVTRDLTSVTLSGTATAAVDGAIQQVLTIVGHCTPATSPCLHEANVGFSFRDLPSAIPVKSGQIVQVSVTFTFS